MNVNVGAASVTVLLVASCSVEDATWDDDLAPGEEDYVGDCRDPVAPGRFKIAPRLSESEADPGCLDRFSAMGLPAPPSIDDFEVDIQEPIVCGYNSGLTIDLNLPPDFACSTHGGVEGLCDLVETSFGQRIYGHGGRIEVEAELEWLFWYDSGGSEQCPLSYFAFGSPR